MQCFTGDSDAGRVRSDPPNAADVTAAYPINKRSMEVELASIALTFALGNAQSEHASGLA